jgi:hypothetical protein
MLEEKWNVSKREIQRVFKEYRDKKAIDQLHVNLSPNKKGVDGMVSKLSIDVRRRIQTISDLAMGKLTYQIIRDQLEDEGFDFCTETVRQYCLQMNVKIASVRVKPKLQEHHKMARIKFILDQIDWTVKSHPVYRSQEKLVHIDEKMFRYLRQVTRLKVFPTSPRFPNSTALSKSHDDQVMFIAAVSEPSSTFDGKIGMLAFLDEVAAERSS